MPPAPYIASQSSPSAAPLGTHFKPSDLYTFADPDDDAITSVIVWLGDGTTKYGHGYLDGMDIPHNQRVVMTMYQWLNNFSYDNTLDGTSNFWVKPVDSNGLEATYWGTAVTFPTATPVTPDQYPAIVNAGGVALAVNEVDNVGARVLASITDADGPLPTSNGEVLFWDDGNFGGTAGHFIYHGDVLNPGQNLVFTTTEAKDVQFIGGGKTDHIYARAFDGTQWGGWDTMVMTAK